MLVGTSARRWLAVALFIACGHDDRGAQPELAPVPPTATTFDVEVGTGTSDYQPIADGAEVDLVRGTQGGWHIWTAFRVDGAALQDVRVNLFARFNDGTSAGEPSSIALLLGARADGEQTHSGMRDFIYDGNQARGRRIVLRVEVIAGDGRHGAGERTVLGR